MIEACLSETGVRKHAASVILGDTTFEIDMARRAAGIQSLGVSSGYHAPDNPHWASGAADIAAQALNRIAAAALHRDMSASNERSAGQRNGSGPTSRSPPIPTGQAFRPSRPRVALMTPGQAAPHSATHPPQWAEAVGLPSGAAHGGRDQTA